MVNWENYEEYILLQADGELDEAGKAALNIFLAKHPGLKKELALYETTRLVPDTDVVYNDKSSLKKPAAKTIVYRNWWVYGVAAGVALLIGFLMLNDHVVTTKVAHNEKPAKDSAKPIINKQQQPVVAIRQPTTNNQRTVTSIQQPATNTRHQHNKIRTEEQIASMPTASMNSVASKEHVNNPENNKQDMPIVTAAHADPSDKKFLAWLPIADEKKQGLNHLKDAVGNTIQKVESIKETAVVLRLGNKNLLTINL